MNVKNNQRRKEILDLIKFLSNTKKIDINIIIGFLKNSIQRIVNSQLDPDAEINLSIENDELILTNQNKLIIEDDEEYKGDSKVVDIHLSEAQKINPNAKVGDTIASRISFDDFSRSLYSKIEQSFRIEILNWEKKRVYEKYQPLIGKTVEAKLEEDFGSKGATFLLDDGTLCYMPTKYMNPNIKLSESKYHIVTIEEVYEKSKNYQVLVSNDSPKKIREIFMKEIPEIERGEILIVAISRIKGERAKVSFAKNPKFEGEIDVLGFVIGKNSERIERISIEIGEKIDVVLYSENIYEYIANSLSPAKIVSINKKTGTNDYLIVVPNKHNTLAIGKKGYNVKLTVELIRVNIDICSYSYAIENGIQILWNGNVKDEEELEKIDFDNSKIFVPRTINQQKRNNKNWKNIGISSIAEFEKEIEMYNSEILSYEPIDYSQFNTNKDDSIDTKFDEISEELENKINKNDIKHVNDNFKFDKDIAGDIDLNDYDFSDFDDE